MTTGVIRQPERLSREEAVMIADGIHARFKRIHQIRREKLKRATERPDRRRSAGRHCAS